MCLTLFDRGERWLEATKIQVRLSLNFDRSDWRSARWVRDLEIKVKESRSFLEVAQFRDLLPATPSSRGSAHPNAASSPAHAAARP